MAKSHQETVDSRNSKTISKPYDEFLQEILEKCAKVKTLSFPEEGRRPDYEAAHGLEDEILHDVVVYISYGRATGQQAWTLANQAAGLLWNLDYPRWTA